MVTVLKCVRTYFRCHPGSPPEASRQSSPAAVSVKRRRATKASSRTVELIDGLDVGSVSALPTRRASMELCCRGTSSAQGTAAQLSPTGRRGYLGGSRGVLCTYPRTSEPRWRRAWPMLCTGSPRGSPVSQEAESAPQREKVDLRHPTVFTFTPPQAPYGPV